MTKIVKCSIELDDFTKKISQAFDYDFDGTSTFTVPEFKNRPDDFNIGIIVGNSGTGKSLLLKEFGQEKGIVWDKSKAIVSHFENVDIALEKLFAAGVSSIPTLCKPYHVLSNGEKFRADIARKLENKAIIDEFTSVVNRETAFSCSVAISKYIKRKNLKNIVLASCHFDIVEWLEPDWVFNTNTNVLDVNEISLEKFPKLGEFVIK
jgi:predicted ATP-binding protein involved in virulence